MRARPTVSVGALLVFVSILTACGSSARGAAPTPSPTPLSPAARDLQRYAAASRDSQFVATYAAQTTGNRTATVGVYVVSTQQYRIDVREGKVTTSLYATSRGAIVCSVATGQVPACFLVAKPGVPIPTQFDAGVQRIFTRDLPGLAADPRAFTITETAALPATATLPAARCFAITSTDPQDARAHPLVADVDLGTYCLSTAGPPRRLTFSSGTLTLTRTSGKPTPADFRLPARVQPLPTPSRSATASASATRSASPAPSTTAPLIPGTPAP